MNSQSIYCSKPLKWCNQAWIECDPPDLSDGNIFTSLRVNKGHLEFLLDHQERLVHSIGASKALLKTFDLLPRIISDLEWSALRLTINSQTEIQIMRRDLFPMKRSGVMKVMPVVVEKPHLVGGQIKRSCYGQVLQDLDLAHAQGFDDLIYIHQNQVLESSFSNVFLVTSDQRIIAPAAREGILEGVYLKNFLVTAQERGIEVERRSISYDELLHAAAVGLSNCLRGIRLAALGEKSYDDEEFFRQWIQPIVEQMHEKDQREMPSL